MLAEIKKLLIIQDRDQKIRDLRKELERIPMEEEAAKAKLNGDLASVAAVHSKIQENEVSIKNLELDIDTRKDSITKLKVQQFQTKKNNEFQAMTKEIENYGQEITKLEDRELEFMEIGETLRAEEDAAKTELNSTQSIIDEELEGFAQRKLECENTIKEHLEDRATHIVGFDEDLLEQYDRIFKKKGDAAVVPLNHGVCGGCHVKVISNTLGIAKAGKSLAQCEQCGRYLYYNE